MTLTLAIETSSIHYGVALRTERDLVADRTLRRDDPSFEGLGPLVSSCLADAGHQIAEVERLAVNVGPGNLGSVRAGVAYANGLAFSLGIGIFGADSLRLLALQSRGTGAGPVLCLRNAGGGNVYAGLFADRRPPRLRHGPMGPVVTALAADLPEVLVAGAFRREVKALLPDLAVLDPGIEFPDVRTLHELLVRLDGAARFVPVATPVDESSSLFHE